MPESEVLADLLSKEIDLAIANGQDLTQAGNRTNFLKKIIEKHPDRKLTIKQLRPSANRAFEKKLGKGNLEKKLGNKKPKFDSKLAQEISARTTEKPSGIVDQAKDNSKPQQKIGTDGKPIQQTTQESTGVPPIKFDHWTTKGIGALFQSFLLPTKAVWPEMPSLTDEEKENLGEVWLPAFQRYGDEKLQFLVFPALATMGIIIPKMAEGRKKHKEAEERKDKTKTDEKLSKQEIEQVNKLTCRYCNGLFDSAHIKSHENTCTKRVG